MPQVPSDPQATRPVDPRQVRDPEMDRHAMQSEAEYLVGYGRKGEEGRRAERGRER